MHGMMNPVSGETDMVSLADAHLAAALRLLDDIDRYDVSAHVDLALHILRGTRGETAPPDPDITA
jgi:hypothetical protein